MVQEIITGILGIMNPVAWVTLVIVLVCVIRGVRMGLVRSVYGTFGFIIAIAVAMTISPHVSDVLMDTPIYSMAYKQVQKTLFNENYTPSTDGEGASGQEAAQAEVGEGQTSDSAETVLINALPLPEFVKEALISNNNQAMYDALGITEFRAYVAAYITKMILRVVMFVLLLLAIGIVLYLVTSALDLVSHLPVLHTLNKFGGLLFGAVNAIIILWILCTVLTLISGTDLGKEIYRQINENSVLSFLYNQNGLMRFIADVQRLFS